MVTTLNNKIRFSILVPAFKRQYLKECLDSIICQTYQNFEIIVVDDASPYRLEEIVSLYSDNRIKYFRNEIGFGGYDVVKNWNKCLEYASGDYVLCMGDDDMLLPNCLSTYLDLIMKYPELNIYHAWTLYIDEHSSKYDLQEARPEWESVYSMMWHLFRSRMQYVGDCLYKTSFLKEIGGYYYMPYAWTSDHITAYLAAAHGGVANTQKPAFLYRVNQMTISRDASVARYKVDAVNCAKKWYDDFLKNEPENELDKLFWSSLLNNKDSFLDNGIAICISEGIKSKWTSIFYWLRNYKNKMLNKRIVFKVVKELIRH